MGAVPISLTAVAVALLLVAESRKSRAGIWIFKPLASTGFVLAAIDAGALDSLYGRIILASLALCWLGDVLLIPKAQAIFRAGILSFLLGHVAFIVAFVARGLDPWWTLAAIGIVSAPSRVVIGWLRPHVPSDMSIPVYAYMAVISTMVACAAGTFGAAGRAAILAGALAFYLSDLSVARDRFVREEFRNRAWGLPLYYAAQLVIASTVY
jgi:uncharacterized membrane protein YhhN